MNFAHSAFALALTYQAQGKPGRAREICNSLVANAIETDNEDVLQIARAFEADLALRQGRHAEAFKWAEGHHTKPFRPTYRFYIPQVTLIRILLGQWLQNKEIAAKLFISPLTVKKHLDNIYGKLNISGRRQAVEKARRLGILPPHKG